MSLIQRVLNDIKHRRDRSVNGEINCIPSPFKSFLEDFPGIEQAKYYLVSAATKGAKTQLTSYLFLYVPLLYAYEHPDKLRLQVFYFPLEETPEKITLRFMSYLLYTKYKIRISPTDLWSVKQGKVFDEEILNVLQSIEMMSILNFFEEHVHFISEKNPTGFYKTITKYAQEAGTMHKKTIVIENKETGIKQEKEVFDYYEPKDPEEYVIIIADHAGKLEQERGMTKKETIDKLSEYFMGFRDRYRYIPVLIQQQNSESISLEAFKHNKIKPSYSGLMDSKQPGQDCSLMLGITNPFAFEVPKYPNTSTGYDITRLRGYARFLEVVLNREGESNGLLALYFDGATNFFAPLPPANDTTNLDKVYKLVQKNMGISP